MVSLPLPALNDSDGDAVPANLPMVIDAHVHVFPKGILASLWQWFDQNAWPVRYRMGSQDIIAFLLSRNVRHIVALQYAHKPGVARQLNRYMARLVQQFPNQITGMATVFPGEDDDKAILREAFEMGLKGVKLHTHVQCFDMNGPEMEAVYAVCAAADKPLILHAGREPKSISYHCDPYQLCRVDKIEQVLKSYPGLNVCVPHLGADEFLAYQQLLESHDNLWLDTAMALTDYLPLDKPLSLQDYRMDRILYGSDFPNLPYAWDRELKWLQCTDLTRHQLALILAENAQHLFGIA